MKVVILGSGTTAKSVANILIENKTINIAGFLGNDEDASRYENKNVIYDIPFLGTYELLKYLEKDQIKGFVVAIGNIRKKEELYFKSCSLNLIPISAISKYAIISNTAKIYDGSIIKSGAIIGHNVRLFQNVKIDTNAVIEINSEIGANSTIGISSVINGECKIKKNVQIGSKVLVKSYMNIGKNQIVKDGQIVSFNLEDLERDELLK